MTLRPYSNRPRRLALQILADVSVLVWIYVWYRVGRFVYDSLVSVAGVGYSIERQAGQVGGSFDQAGRSVNDVPLVGNQLAAPLTNAGRQIAGIASAGRDAGDRLSGFATPAGWLVALVPILLVLAVWLPMRLRYARRAGAIRELAAAPAGVELLALRALTNQPLHALTRVSDDPVQAWRDGEPEVNYALAQLELAALGVPWPPGRRGRPASRPSPASTDGPTQVTFGPSGRVDLPADDRRRSAAREGSCAVREHVPPSASCSWPPSSRSS